MVVEEPLRPVAKLASFPTHIVGELLVTDETICPEVGDVDFEFIRAGFGKIGDVDSERGFPERGDGFAVEPNSAQFADVAEVEV